MEWDCILINKKWYFIQVSVGNYAKTIDKVRDKVKQRWGMLAYVYYILKGLYRWKKYNFKLKIDNKEMRVKGSELIIANTGLFLNKKYKLFPKIKASDGKFDLLVFNYWNVLSLVSEFFKIILRKERAPELVKIGEGKKIEILNEDIPAQADGDIAGKTPIEISLIKSGIRFIK